MVYTFSGSNSFLLQAELQQRIAVFVDEHTDMGLERLDGEDSPLDRIRAALESMPFLVSRKLVVLSAPSAIKQFMEQAEQLLSNVPDVIDVIIVEPKLDKRTAYYKYVQKHTEFRVFDELDEGGLSRWLVERAKSQGARLSMGDARYLVGRVGLNQQMLSHDLDKLALYAPEISKQSIDLLVEQTPQGSVFELLDAAFAGRAQLALRLYAEQRKARVEPQQIMAMVAWQLHVLAIVKAAGGNRDATTIAKDAKINPYVVRKSANIASGIGGPRLKKLIHEAVVLDTRLKSEALDADDAIQDYIFRLANSL